MSDEFDELARGMAQTVSQRPSLKKFCVRWANFSSVVLAAHCHCLSCAGAAPVQQAYLKPSNNRDPGCYGCGFLFGDSVAASGDTVVVGAPGEASKATGVNGDQNDASVLGAGAAYVFVRNGLNWTQQA